MFEPAQRVTAAFRDTFGRDPDGVWAAPGRVNLIGEHTDYNDGLVLPIALPQRTFAAARRRDDDLLRLVSLETDGALVEIAIGDVAPGRPASWGAYAAGVVAILRAEGFAVRGMDIVVTSTVPIGAGLSSSAALEGAVGAAASDLFGLGLLDDDEGRRRLAAVCQRAENEIAQAPTGGMDQAASLRSRAGNALLLDCRDGSVDHVPFALERSGLAILIIDTKAHHELVDGQYGERRASCEAAARELGVASLREVELSRLPESLAALSSELLVKRARHVVTEIDRVRQAAVALRAADYDTLGLLFIQSHDSMRDDFEISCPELDLAVDTALAHGALGARMTGGGFGGSAIALVPAATAEKVGNAVTRAFAEARYTDPHCFVALAAGPACRVG